MIREPEEFDIKDAKVRAVFEYGKRKGREELQDEIIKALGLWERFGDWRGGLP